MVETNFGKKIEEFEEKHEKLINRMKEVAKNIIEKPREIMPTILAANLYLENCMNSLIEDNFKKSEPILRYTFAQKITILNSMGILNDEHYSALKTMNELRNLFAHELFVEDSKIKSKMTTLEKFDKTDKARLTNTINSISINLSNEIIDHVYVLK